MSLSLNQINASAYAKAAAALEQNGKATVAHPTGSGKSCIAWQLVADHPQASFVWLVYGQARLTLRKADVSRYTTAFFPQTSSSAIALLWPRRRPSSGSGWQPKSRIISS